MPFNEQVKLEDALRLAADAGVVMLQAGGEINRVEETIERIGRTYAASRVDSYATPTGLFVTGEAPDGHSYTLVRRVHATGNNLTIIAAVNDLSRRSERGELDLASARLGLQKIMQAPPPYPPVVLVFCAGIASAAFAHLLGAPVKDLWAAALAGLCVQTTVVQVDKKGWGAFARAWAGGLTAAVVARGLNYLTGISVNWAIIGSIMTLVPGLAITNALRDIMGGQLVSGVARSVEALAIAVGIAAGVGLVLGLGGR